ncbi:MAG: CNNM domain-containing protein [Pirellulaceae bacterium]
MIAVAGAMFACGLAMSAFFSGSETGFYRATRVRLAMDGLSGDRVSQGLLWLTNNPSLFVATTLVGNNIANYLSSLAVVLGTQGVLGTGHAAAELVAPMLVTPIVFIYGELLPKNLFFQAPNKLLRWSGPLFLLCVVVFSPIALLLWMLGRLLQYVLGESPEFLRLRLAREELRRVLEEGHAAGILHPSQRRVAHAMLDMANNTAQAYSTLPARMTSVTNRSSLAELIRLARRERSPHLLVTDSVSREPIGYVRVIEAHLSRMDWTRAIRPLAKVRASDSHIAAAFHLQDEEAEMAVVTDEHDRILGVLQSHRVLAPVMSEA